MGCMLTYKTPSFTVSFSDYFAQPSDNLDDALLTMAAAQSPMRRVLADKNKNAGLRVNKHAKPTPTVQITPVKASITPDHGLKVRKDLNEIPSPKIRQKRKIEEVEDVEGEDSQDSNDTQSLSDPSDTVDYTDAEPGDSTLVSTNDTASTAATTLPSFHASQAEIGPTEAQFEIHEEMSQQTLDKLHAISLPPNNSISFLRPSLLKDNSQLSVSMSDLIDFEQNDSQPEQSQQRQDSNDAEKDQHDLQTAEDTRRNLLDEKAATLRTRLQLAFFKILTNQASTPFSRLAQPSKSASPPPQPYSSSPMSSPHFPTRNSYVNSPESRIAIARARATMQKKPPVRPLADIALPHIRPTAYSARWQPTDHTTEQQQILSSPPDSQGPELRISAMAIGIETPGPGSKRPPHTPMQLSSPPGSPNRGINTAAKMVQRREAKYGGLTSSVVKGEAANSLLQLTRAGGVMEEVRQMGGCGF